MIETIPCKEGSAPLYVLEGDLGPGGGCMKGFW